MIVEKDASLLFVRAAKFRLDLRKRGKPELPALSITRWRQDVVVLEGHDQLGREALIRRGFGDLAA